VNLVENNGIVQHKVHVYTIDNFAATPRRYEGPLKLSDLNLTQEY